MTRYLLALCLAGLVLAWPPQAAHATPTTLQDATAASANADGTINAGEYATSAGINSGFGGVIGPAQLGVDSDVLGNLVWSLSGTTGGCSGNNHIVVYIDSTPGGPNSTSLITDIGDAGRRAISGSNTGGSADLNFAPGFEPDRALIITSAFVGTFEINAPNLTFGQNLTATSTFIGGNCDVEISGMTLADLGIIGQGSFRYMATVLNPNDPTPFRSDEFHGVAASTVPSGNPGNAAVTLAAGDFNTFEPVVVLINEVDSDQSGADTEEFVELLTRPAQVDLSGLILVGFNGNSPNNVSYQLSTASASIDLASGVSGADGLFVIGTTATPNVDQTIGASGRIENGADAVAIYLDTTANWPAGTAPTTTNLVDALVYDLSLIHI